MSSGGATLERLQHYLRELSPEACALLIAELERGLLRGDDEPGCDLVLSELRRIIRDSERPQPRIGNSARLFFKPFEPFLVDDVPEHTHPGRIARACLDPLWRWIQRDIAPEETKAFTESVSKALLANDAAAVDALTRTFQDQVAHNIGQALAGAQDDPAQRKLLAQIGTQRAGEDVKSILSVLRNRDTLESLAARLPGHVDNFSEAQLSNVKAFVDFAAARDPQVFIYGVLLVMSRLSAPWQLIRLATHAADSRAAARVSETPYAVAVTIVLNEAERLVGELAADLRSGRGVAVTGLLKCIHDSARGLRTELDLTIDSKWGKQLAVLRAQISDLLKSEIESVPGRVRRLLRPRPTKEIPSGTALDAQDVAEIEAALDFVNACRGYAGELAINEITQRTFSELQQYLDTGTRALLDGLRHAGEPDRPFRQSQVDAAVRFCARIFGRDYASLLSKASEVAATGERKVVRA